MIIWREHIDPNRMWLEHTGYVERAEFLAQKVARIHEYYDSRVALEISGVVRAEEGTVDELKAVALALCRMEGLL
jgi:hypothetical protein